MIKTTAEITDNGTGFSLTKTATSKKSFQFGYQSGVSVMKEISGFGAKKLMISFPKLREFQTAWLADSLGTQSASRGSKTKI